MFDILLVGIRAHMSMVLEIREVLLCLWEDNRDPWWISSFYPQKSDQVHGCS